MKKSLPQTLKAGVAVERNERVERYLDIFKRELETHVENCRVEFAEGESLDRCDLIFDVQESAGREGYTIADEDGGAVRITGHDELGLLYGIGQFLRDADWRGTSIPQGEVRGMYFAFHNNWYSKAPTEKVQRYIEELALWGMNSLLLHLRQYENPHTPEARAALQRDYDIARHARQLGLKIGLLKSPNMGYEESTHAAPERILAPEFPDTDPPRRGHHGERICPSTPEGFAYLSHKLEAYLEGYEDLGLDFVAAFPYDAGGCGCERCWPWGARGYVTICKEFSRLAKAKYPGCKFVLSTWCYDVREESDGEYEGLEKVLAEDKSRVDYIMADSHEQFPEYPLRPGALVGLPIINFAEISMWGRFPWGGSGANPLPARFQKIWDQSGHRLAGGFPYSEGNFDDINKSIFFRFFWDCAAQAEDTVREYVRYEFGSKAAAEISEAIYLLEKTYPQWERRKSDVERAYQLIMEADEKIPAALRAGWRWQILYWRAVIDWEIAGHDGVVSDRCDDAYESLIALQHLEDGWHCVTPPSRAYRARQLAQQAVAELPPGAEPERDAASLPIAKAMG
jgi:hypothetical protein